MNFGAIIERALKLTRQHTVLWKLGLLALFTEGVTGGFISGPPLPTPPPSPEEAQKSAEFTARAEAWINANVELAVAFVVLAIFVLIILWYISLRAKAGMMKAVATIEDGGASPSFRQTFASGRDSIWRLIGLYLAFGIAVAVVIGVPMAFVATAVEKQGEQAIWIAFIALIPVFIVFAAYAAFVTKMAERAVVLGQMRVFAALKHAHHLLRHRLGQAAIALLIDFAIQILFMLFLVAIAVIGIGLAALLGMLLLAILPKAIMAAVIGAVAVLSAIGFLLLAGWFASFTISYWTLIYRAFDYLTKEKETK